MKMRTVGGEWYITDGTRKISVSEGEVAFGYAFVMAQIRAHKCITPSIAPVRSLVPHPKKRRIPKKWRDKVKAVKQRISLKNI